VTRDILKSKIHGAVITAAHPNYEGSLTIPVQVMKDADILAYERILVLNFTTGDRFETYAIPGPDATAFESNGPAARLAQVDDTVFVLTFASLKPADLAAHRIRIVVMEDRNRSHRVIVREYAAEPRT
jgi:aspartate 1-decarboxylase